MHHEKVTLKATLFDVSTAGLHQTIAAQELNDTRPAGMGGEGGGLCVLWYCSPVTTRLCSLL